MNSDNNVNMVQDANLYTILLSYSKKINSPFIEIDSFLAFLENCAKKYSPEYPVWQKWLNNTSVRFWSDISYLAEDGKCELIEEYQSSKIYMPLYYPELLNTIYSNTEENADLPFPSEELLKFKLPKDHLLALDSDFELLGFLDKPSESSAQIVRLKFPDDCGSTLVLASMIPKQIAESAIIKIRNYLRRYGNREYVLHKLAPQLRSRESFLESQLDEINLRPLVHYNSIEAGGEFTYLFWAHLCTLIKSDIRKKQEHLPVDIAAFQAVYIIEVVNGFYKSMATKKRDKEAAFKHLENHLSKTPYYFTMGDIVKFKSPKGTLLLSQYTSEELEDWLRKKTSESEGDKLPELLIMHGLISDEPCFVLKYKMLLLCTRFLIEGRFLVKRAVSKHWNKLLLNYKKEPAMESDEEFEKYLETITAMNCPALTTILEDQKLVIVYQEMEQNGMEIPVTSRIIDHGLLLPHSLLFNLRRKELLSSTKLTVPFWYSMPIISAIISFFKNLQGKRRAEAVVENEEENEQDLLGERDEVATLRAAAEEIEVILVPSGYTLDLYLEELEDRWSKLINRKARENLIDDVKYLVRDSLKRTLRVDKQFKPTQKRLNQLAYDIVIRNRTLTAMDERDALLIYIQLYMVKLLQGVK